MKSAVVLAGGQSTRMFPISQDIPKPLVKVAGKTLLHWVVEGLAKAGIQKVYVVVKYQKEKLEEELEVLKGELGVSIEPVEQGERKGTAAALMAASFLNEPFLVAMGDAALDWRIFRDVIRAYKEQGEDIVVVKEVPDPSRFGVVKIENGRITKLVEKPKVPFSRLVNTGIYAFSPTIFSTLERVPLSPRGEYELTHVLVGKRALITDKFLIDVGYPWSILEALSFYLDGQSIIRGEVEGQVVGPVYIDKDSVVEEGAVVGPLVQMEGSVVGRLSNVRESILWESRLMGMNHVVKSVMAKTTLGPGVIVEHISESEVVVDTGKRVIPTTLKELGMVGNNAYVGAGTILLPGSVVNNARVKEHSIVRGYVGR